VTLLVRWFVVPAVGAVADAYSGNHHSGVEVGLLRQHQETEDTAGLMAGNAME
jgi:hypothetical protein